MLTSKRTEVSSHPWAVSCDSSLCYLGDSASTPLLRHPLYSSPAPIIPQVCAFSYLPCFGSNPHAFDNVFQLLFWSLSNAILKSFSSFPLHHKVFKLKLFSYASLNTALMSFILLPPNPPCTSGRHPAGLGLTLHWVTRKHWGPSLLLVYLVVTFLLLMTQCRSFSP